ncbi:hypothetical protein ABZ345_21510 [Lentzea sp. NPDC005914]
MTYFHVRRDARRRGVPSLLPDAGFELVERRGTRQALVSRAL